MTNSGTGTTMRGRSDDVRNYVNGMDGADTIYGAGGNDNLRGDAGDDTIYGGAGNDSIYGDTGSNTIYGDAGNDNIFLDEGTDIVDGGSGSDAANYQYSSTGITADLGAGTVDENSDGIIEDMLTSIEKLYGSNHDDHITGRSTGDILQGKSGNDILIGGGGNDTLQGGHDDDILYGQDGVDYLYGNGGSDTFVFENDTAFNNIDNIYGFKLTENDKIDLSDLLSQFDPLTENITDFVQITESGSHSILAVDSDGGADNFVQIATLHSTSGLTDEEALETSGNLITF